MSIEVINQQGAQVVALQERVQTLEVLVALLAGKPGEFRWGPTTQEGIGQKVGGFGWSRLKDGTIVLKVSKP